MQSRLVKYISSLLASVLAATLLVVGTPAASNAKGTADYTYVCVYFGTTPGQYTMKKGTPLTTCENAMIEVYLNGRQVDHYYTGYQDLKKYPRISVKSASCIFAIAGGVIGVLGTGGGAATVASSGLGVLSSCLA
jgi:hypothetical protein